MESLLLPKKIQYQPGETPYKGTFTIEPCYYGYGTTLGNTLRRVLLSSLPGASVTAININGVQHEFSTVPHVKEDVVEIILNFKLLRLKVFSEEPVMLKLSVKGEREVTAGDIEPNASVEIVNKDLHLATLTDAKASLEMDITVSQGRGYVTTEGRDKEKFDLGTIAIDSIFTPIVNVGFKVENTRVGQITNYDKLIMTLETDGTITPQEAFKQSVDILLDHFNLLKQYEQAAETAGEESASETSEPDASDVSDVSESSEEKKE